jgi:glycosyltransferase involved in cell wall biosynthesis
MLLQRKQIQSQNRKEQKEEQEADANAVYSTNTVEEDVEHATGTQDQKLLYLHKYLDGGARTFTIHLMHKLSQSVVYRVRNRTEPKLHDFGYGLSYKNISDKDASKMDNSVIVIFKENFLHVLESLKNPTLVIHGEVDISKKSIPCIKDLKIITIRKTLQKYLKEEYGLDSIFKFLPFHPYPIILNLDLERKGAVSISRISFEKNIDMIVKANKLLDNPVKIYGRGRRLYVHFTFRQLTNILSRAKYVVDLSVYKNDGGGMNYTFLEAIHNRCALILHRKWLEFEPEYCDFKEGYNCYAVDSPKELAELINCDTDTTQVVSNAHKLLQRHIDVSWSDIF